MLLAGGLSLQSPSFMAVAVDGVPPRERGAAMATYTGFFDVANALIGPVFGLIVSGLGYRAAFLTAGALSVLALAILRGMVAPRYRAGRAR
jgi:MFS family permease